MPLVIIFLIVLVTKEAKKLLAEFLSRVAQILFAMLVVGPFVTGNLKAEFIMIGLFGAFGSLFLALMVSFTVKKED